MARWIDLDELLASFEEYIDEFERIVRYSDPSEMIERLQRWKIRVAQFLRNSVSEEEAKRFETISLRFDPLVPPSFNAMLESHRNALIILAEEIVAHPNELLGNESFVATRPKLRRLFVSHAAADRPLAEYLRDQLLKRRPGTDIFLASRPGHIRTGEEWWQTIQRELKTADSFVVLLTPLSIDRPWIPFETGAAWMTGRPVYTVSAGGLDKSEIRNPIAFFQVNCLEVVDEAEAFLTDIGAAADDTTEFCVGIRRVAGAVAAAAESASGWVGVDVGGRFFAWDGPELHSFPERPPTPTPGGLIDAIREAGFTPSYGTRDKLTRHLAAGRLQVFETDRKTFQRAVFGGGAGEDQILLVRPGDEA